MKPSIHVLSDQDCRELHTRSLDLLERVGMRIASSQACELLARSGALVEPASCQVRFPAEMIENALTSAPRTFSLGARRPEWDLKMNIGECSLLADGEGVYVLDRKSGERRASTFEDWVRATRFIDALDEIGVYWSMVEGGQGDRSHADMIRFWRTLFANFSKHVQDSLQEPGQAPWLLEVLEILFGDRETIRREHPFSFLYCPQSPLVLEEAATDAYLALRGLDIPVAIMPMPLMGATAPGSLISTLLLANCEVLGALCLIQCAEPGTPCLYAPVSAVINPRTGLYSGGAIEQSLLSAASIEMARYYGLPSEGTGFGSDHFIPGVQAAIERSLNSVLPALEWPDILVGPGLLGGSMVLSLEQLLLDVEIFRKLERMRRGINVEAEAWLEAVIREIGPGGNYLGHPSTRAATHSGEWYLSKIGVHDPYDSWVRRGKPTLLVDVRREAERLLETHQPLPLDPDVERELQRLEQEARRHAS
jgi:trimethylamine--corrinoid protein Co-methyltransferase